MANFNLKAALREIISLVLIVVGLVIFCVTSFTGYLAGTSVNVLPIVFSIVAIVALGVDVAMGDRLPAVARDLLVMLASAMVVATFAMFIWARVTLAADVYFIPVNYPAAEETALHISIAGAVCYLLAEIVLIVEAFAAKRPSRETITVVPATA